MGRQDQSGIWRVIDLREIGCAPDADEVEITVLGPGYGESIVVHIGQGRWIIVDSCINDARDPQALEYLLAIGVEPRDAVRLIVATHWHDDHIGGMSKLVDACPAARFCCAVTLRREEFYAAIHALNRGGAFAGSSGVRELHTLFEALAERGSKPHFVSADTRLFTDGSCEIWTLSPHNDEVVRFLESIGTLFPKVGETTRRVGDVSPNQVAVVLWIKIHDAVILLGADLERRGWVKLVESQGRPQQRGKVFKVPHHGAASAYDPGVWQEMLEPNPIAVLTPWRRGGRALPEQDEMRRILAETEHAYLTSGTDSGARPRRRDSGVERSIQEANIRLRRIAPRWGAVRLRRQVNTETEWLVKLFGQARHLVDLVI